MFVLLAFFVIVLAVLFRFPESYYPFGIFKLFSQKSKAIVFSSKAKMNIQRNKTNILRFPVCCIIRWNHSEIMSKFFLNTHVYSKIYRRNIPLYSLYTFCFPMDDVVLEILTQIVVFINILTTFMLIFDECFKYLFTTCH